MNRCSLAEVSSILIRGASVSKLKHASTGASWVTLWPFVMWGQPHRPTQLGLIQLDPTKSVKRLEFQGSLSEGPDAHCCDSAVPTTATHQRPVAATHQCSIFETFSILSIFVAWSNSTTPQSMELHPNKCKLLLLFKSYIYNYDQMNKVKYLFTCLKPLSATLVNTLCRIRQWCPFCKAHFRLSHRSTGKVVAL